ncbi:MAG: cob(I)yrinic acid a,c-diamide adenosyltransferase [Candidatus Aenigmarchaeota archaeon]|nr:cob(I)yrinic acid a,c-diamide adenosyltransferase [Candidatus Aenigmarchaeota archaeon]
MKQYRDSTKTSVHRGPDVSKASAIVDACGTVDELNAFVGVAKAEIADKEIYALLTDVQNGLFRLGADIATPLGRDVQRITAADVQQLESVITAAEKELSPLRRFILPGGSDAAAALHVCRTVCRRAERILAALSERGEINSEAFRYANRLSDMFFIIARLVNSRIGLDEQEWKG